MACIPPTLEGWVYIIPIHGPLYTWAQYTPTVVSTQTNVIFFFLPYVSIIRLVSMRPASLIRL